MKRRVCNGGLARRLHKGPLGTYSTLFQSYRFVWPFSSCFAFFYFFLFDLFFNNFFFLKTFFDCGLRRSEGVVKWLAEHTEYNFHRPRLTTHSCFTSYNIHVITPITRHCHANILPRTGQENNLAQQQQKIVISLLISFSIVFSLFSPSV